MAKSTSRSLSSLWLVYHVVHRTKFFHFIVPRHSGLGFVKMIPPEVSGSMHEASSRTAETIWPCSRSNRNKYWTYLMIVLLEPRNHLQWGRRWSVYIPAKYKSRFGEWRLMLKPYDWAAQWTTKASQNQPLWYWIRSVYIRAICNVQRESWCRGGQSALSHVKAMAARAVQKLALVMIGGMKHYITEIVLDESHNSSITVDILAFHSALKNLKRTTHV